MLKIAETRAPHALVVDIEKVATKTILVDYTKLPATYIPYGTVVGTITATGKARLYPVAKVKTGAAAVSTIALKQVSGPYFVIPFVVGEAVTVGTDDVVITGIDHVNGTITVTPAITVVANEDVVLTTPDGSEVADGVLYTDISNDGRDYWSGEDRQCAAIDWGLLYEAGCVNLDSDAKTALSKYILFR